MRRRSLAPPRTTAACASPAAATRSARSRSPTTCSCAWTVSHRCSTSTAARDSCACRAASRSTSSTCGWPSTGSHWRTSAMSTCRRSPARSRRPRTARVPACATSHRRSTRSRWCSPTARPCTCAEALDADVFRAARVSLGALGVIAEVTLRCVPAFTLRGVDAPRPLDDTLARFDELALANEHFEFFVFPHAAVALTRTNNRTDAPPRPRARAVRLCKRHPAHQLRLRAVLPRGQALPARTSRRSTVS